MGIQEQIQDDLKAAMRGGDKLRVQVLRMAMASLKNAQIAQVKQAYDAAAPAEGSEEVTLDRSAGLSEATVLDTLAREVKRRREAAEAYRQGKREDLAAEEDSEAAILETYLPKKLSADELRPLVAAVIAEVGASSPAEINKVMPVLMQRFKSQADGRVLSQLARELLSQPG
ncbi:MAG TPA: GatB/YqeY domain-containing protein [Roseiflexaceae bacterium]|nr:GatB/YqeY domain-containing protein [Roseiflexaceae bacterium]